MPKEVFEKMVGPAPLQIFVSTPPYRSSDRALIAQAVQIIQQKRRSASMALVARIRRVFASCRTEEQRQAAYRYLSLAWPRIPRDMKWGLMEELAEMGRRS